MSADGDRGRHWEEAFGARGPLIAPQSTPDETLADRARVDRIREVLDAEGYRTREMYFPHRAGYSYAEIAEHMKISQRAIKRHVVRAVLAIMEHEEL
jgi:DNA-directed RNA polymerase specialized sigma24 family protein